MRFAWLIQLILTMLTASSSAELTYCKCTCGKSSILHILQQDLRQNTKPCTACTKQFCIEQSPDICSTQNDGEISIYTDCFQRESLKDEAIVFIFLVLTVSLLGYAMVIKPIIEKRRTRHSARYGTIVQDS